MKNNQNPLTLTNVSFKFSKHGSYFFKDICLMLMPGSHYFVCGKNGVGKSTFFRILQGRFESEELCTGMLSTSGNVSVVHQDVSTMLADKLTVQENLQCALLPTYP